MFQLKVVTEVGTFLVINVCKLKSMRIVLFKDV